MLLFTTAVWLAALITCTNSKCIGIYKGTNGSSSAKVLPKEDFDVRYTAWVEKLKSNKKRKGGFFKASFTKDTGFSLVGTNSSS